MRKSGKQGNLNQKQQGLAYSASPFFVRICRVRTAHGKNISSFWWAMPTLPAHLRSNSATITMLLPPPCVMPL